jgi:hypothetical protein
MAARAQAPTKSQTKLTEPAPEAQIRVRAYEIYVASGGQSGPDPDDWLKADAEISTGRADAPREEN